MQSSLQAIVERHNEYKVKRAQKKYYLLKKDGDVQPGKIIIKLNPTAYYIWQQLAEIHTVEGITQALIAKYTIDETTAQKDIKGFLEDLNEIL